MSTKDVRTYRQELLGAMRMRRVDPERIGEAVAEVEAHVADTGEDPREAFGPAREYARRFPSPLDDTPRSRRRLMDAREAAVGAVVGLLGAMGVVGLVDGESFLGIPAAVCLAVSVLLAVPVIAELARRAGTARDPRTGDPIGGTARTTGLIIGGGYVLLLALVAGVALAAR
jgi:hypothetical protein